MKHLFKSGAAALHIDNFMNFLLRMLFVSETTKLQRPLDFATTRSGVKIFNHIWMKISRKNGTPVQSYEFKIEFSGDGGKWNNPFVRMVFFEANSPIKNAIVAHFNGSYQRDGGAIVNKVRRNGARKLDIWGHYEDVLTEEVRNIIQNTPENVDRSKPRIFTFDQLKEISDENFAKGYNRNIDMDQVNPKDDVYVVYPVMHHDFAGGVRVETHLRTLITRMNSEQTLAFQDISINQWNTGSLDYEVVDE